MDDVTLTHLIAGTLGGIPGWMYDPDREDEYPADVVAVSYGLVRPTPDRAVAVRVYGGDDPDDLAVRRVQIRYRGAPGRIDGADELAQAGFDRLHRALIPGVAYISRISFGPLGSDGNRREERSDNYQIILDNKES